MDATPAGDGGTTVDIAAAADGADTAIGLEQLSESASGLNIVPSGVDCIYFVFGNNDLVAIEFLSTVQYLSPQWQPPSEHPQWNTLGNFIDELAEDVSESAGR